MNTWQYSECGFQNHRNQSLLSVFIGHAERISIIYVTNQKVYIKVQDMTLEKKQPFKNQTICDYITYSSH